MPFANIGDTFTEETKLAGWLGKIHTTATGASSEISFCTEAGGGIVGGVGALVPQQAMWPPQAAAHVEPVAGLPHAAGIAGTDAKSDHTSNPADKMAANRFMDYFLASASAAWIFLM